jgi:hypothetical protein
MSAGMKDNKGWIKKLGFPALLFFVLGCANDNTDPSRSFYMGFTPFPYDISIPAQEYVYNQIDQNADIINHHFDSGVPWPEALGGDPFHQQVTDDWNYRKSKTNPNHQIYLSVTPINFSRNGLAPYRGAEDNMALPAPWDTYKFNDEHVKTAYLNYCKRIVDFFEPDYFNMAIEANLLYVINASAWTEYMELHEYIYTELKSEYPELPIFCSVSGAYLLEGYFDNNDHVQQRLAVMQLLEYSDMYTISFYPYLTNHLANPYPPNSFEELFALSDKPLAIAETGYAAQSFTIDMGAGSIDINSDPDKQDAYINDLLSSCVKGNAVFVINFVLRDYDQLWEDIGSPHDIYIAWRDTGLFDENGNPRKALGTWKKYLQRKHTHTNPD